MVSHSVQINADFMNFTTIADRLNFSVNEVVQSKCRCQCGACESVCGICMCVCLCGMCVHVCVSVRCSKVEADEGAMTVKATPS